MGLLAKANRMKYEGYEIIATPEENGKVNVWVSFKKLGDQDFITDVLDIVQLINIIVGNLTPDSYQMWSGDLNSDNYFDVLDIVLLVNIILDR